MATKKRKKISQAFTKSQLVKEISERCDLNKNQVTHVLDEMKDIIASHLKKNGPEKFTLPGILKIQVRNVDAKPSREGINPFTKEPTVYPAKAASRKVRVTPLKQLKEMA
ncbi:MAG: DNA-binding protein [Francisellaceae bacterium]|jgi:nucleoid DNA-binding protein|nr:DNA-binding protein [Francisellaceae bacterium]MBT6206837.1 DNA-binding protein [Francisellaceae bacterium]MBT6538708.1 DNA-binding protein [Francisellaceae bacterium]